MSTERVDYQERATSLKTINAHLSSRASLNIFQMEGKCSLHGSSTSIFPFALSLSRNGYRHFPSAHMLGWVWGAAVSPSPSSLWMDKHSTVGKSGSKLFLCGFLVNIILCFMTVINFVAVFVVWVIRLTTASAPQGGLNWQNHLV